MTSFRRLALVFILAVSVMALFTGCKGKTGPIGPAGEKGDTGAQGPQGEKGDPGDPGGGGGTIRTVIKSQAPVPPLPDPPPDPYQPFAVDIDGITLDDPALVSVFVNIEGGSEWDECPVPYIDGADNQITAYATLREGGIDLWFCEGFDYIIIVIE